MGEVIIFSMIICAIIAAVYVRGRNRAKPQAPKNNSGGGNYPSFEIDEPIKHERH